MPNSKFELVVDGCVGKSDISWEDAWLKASACAEKLAKKKCLLVGPRGPSGTRGPTGPRGPTGTIDTSSGLTIGGPLVVTSGGASITGNTTFYLPLPASTSRSIDTFNEDAPTIAHVRESATSFAVVSRKAGAADTHLFAVTPEDNAVNVPYNLDVGKSLVWAADSRAALDVSGGALIASAAGSLIPALDVSGGALIVGATGSYIPALSVMGWNSGAIAIAATGNSTFTSIAGSSGPTMTINSGTGASGPAMSVTGNSTFTSSAGSSGPAMSVTGNSTFTSSAGSSGPAITINGDMNVTGEVTTNSINVSGPTIKSATTLTTNVAPTLSTSSSSIFIYKLSPPSSVNFTLGNGVTIGQEITIIYNNSPPLEGIRKITITQQVYEGRSWGTLTGTPTAYQRPAVTLYWVGESAGGWIPTSVSSTFIAAA